MLPICSECAGASVAGGGDWLAAGGWLAGGLVWALAGALAASVSPKAAAKAAMPVNKLKRVVMVATLSVDVVLPDMVSALTTFQLWPFSPGEDTVWSC